MLEQRVRSTDLSVRADDQDALSGRRLATAAMIMTLSNVVKILLQLAMLPVMGRLLGPQEFGLYALALPTVTFLQMLADGGLGNSLAREAESSEAVWSTAFWLLHAFAALLAVAVVGWSFVLAYLSHQPRLPAIMAVLSISLLLLASSILPGARLMRRARMAVGAIADVVANLIGAGVGIGLALRHAGAWSLVAQYLTVFAVRAVILNFAAPHLPALQLNLRALTPHFAVGGAIVGSKFSDFMGRLLENTLISRSLGASLLGAYSFGNQIPRFLCEAAANPLWASLYVQALRRDRPAALRSYYKLSRLLGLVLFPSTFLIAAATPQLVPLLLGPSWRAAIPIVAIILPTYAMVQIGSQSSAMLYACGRSDITLWNVVLLAIGRLAVVAAAPVIGIVGVAMGVGLANVVYGCVSIITPAKAIGSSPWLVAKELAGPLAAAAAAGTICLVLVRLHPSEIAWTCLSVATAAVAWLVLVILIEGRRLKEDFALLRQALGRA